MAEEVTPVAGAEGVVAPTPEAPTPIELRDDAVVKLPGSDKPVKWGDYYKGFQSDYTKKSQALAQFQREVPTLRQQLQERERQLQQLASQLGAVNQPAPEDPFAGLKGKTYLDGESAYALADNLRKMVGGTTSELQKRDQALRLIAQYIQRQDQTLNELRGERQSQAFETKISGFLKQLDLDDEWRDFAKETYLAYEGEDLDQEFPNILRQRVEQAEKLLNARRQRKMQSARQLPFTPGKGGNGMAGKPLSLAGKSSREVADLLWDQMDKSDASEA